MVKSIYVVGGLSDGLQNLSLSLIPCIKGILKPFKLPDFIKSFS